MIDKAIDTPRWRGAVDGHVPRQRPVGCGPVCHQEHLVVAPAQGLAMVGERPAGQADEQSHAAWGQVPQHLHRGPNARQIGYLLSGMSVLARLAGYSGLCVLIDEAESYSLLQAYQPPKADEFFSAVIYAALQERQTRITADMLPNIAGRTIRRPTPTANHFSFSSR